MGARPNSPWERTLGSDFQALGKPSSWFLSQGTVELLQKHVCEISISIISARKSDLRKRMIICSILHENVDPAIFQRLINSFF